MASRHTFTETGVDLPRAGGAARPALMLLVAGCVLRRPLIDPDVGVYWLARESGSWSQESRTSPYGLARVSQGCCEWLRRRRLRSSGCAGQRHIAKATGARDVRQDLATLRAVVHPACPLSCYVPAVLGTVGVRGHTGLGVSGENVIYDCSEFEAT
jgi:hypothetical protein